MNLEVKIVENLSLKTWVGESDIFERNVTLNLGFLALILFHLRFVCEHIKNFLNSCSSIDNVGITVGDS
jgi:hypothetical protein